MAVHSSESDTLIRNCDQTNVVEIFHQIVASYPETPAIAIGDWRLTYGELDQRSNLITSAILAHRDKLPVEPMVYIQASKLEHQLIAMVGALKAGAGVSFAGVNAPADSVCELCENAKLDILAVDHNRANQFEQMESRSMLLLNIEEALEQAAYFSEPLPQLSPEHICRIVFTSGSTGSPKGVEHSHKSVLHTVQRAQNCLHFRPGERQLLLSPLEHMTGSSIVFTSILSGTTLCPYPIHEHGVDRLASWLGENKIHHVRMSVTVFRSLVASSTHGSSFESVKTLWLGGEKTLLVDAENFQTKFPHGSRLVINFGSSECSCISQCVIDQQTDLQAIPTLSGYPAEGKEIKIVGRDGQIAPSGEVGEIQVTSQFLARGYRNRPDLTEERFIFSDKMPALITVMTGDFGRWLEDGRLECVGRRDNMVKINGHRVECNDVESALLAHPDVDLAAVQAVETRPGNHRLIAHIAPVAGWKDADFHLLEDNLRQQLANRVPAYCIPAAFKFSKSFPMTTSGKLDRQKIFQLAENKSTEQHRPLDEDEEIIADIWKGILKTQTISPSDNFFILGGDSLNAANLVLQIARTTQVSLEIGDVFRFPELPRLAERFRQAKTRADEAVLDTPDALDSLTQQQSYFYFLDQSLPNPEILNCSLSLKLAGELNPERLREALKRLVQRHEIYRTTYSRSGESVRPVVVSDAAFNFEFVSADGALDEQDAERRINQFTAAPFDLKHGPVGRALLLRLSPHDWRLTLCIHHIATDAGNWSLLWNELRALYFDVGNEATPAGSGIDNAYQELRIRQARNRSQRLHRAQQFWRQQLADLPQPLDTSLLCPDGRPTTQTDEPGYRFELSEAWTNQIEQLARTQASTVYSVLLAIVFGFLRKCFQQDDLIIGVPTNERLHPLNSKTQGCLVKMLPMRIAPQSDQPIGALIQSVGAHLLAALEHDCLSPLEMLEATGEHRKNGLYEVIFRMRETKQTFPPLASTQSVQRLDLHQEASQTPLMFEHIQSADRSHIALSFDHAKILPADAQRLLGYFKNYLHTFLSSTPSTPLSAVGITSTDELLQISTHGQGPANEYPRDTDIAQLFDKVAEAHPDEIAIQCGDAQLSYSEAKTASQKLAAGLIALGVKAGDRIGIYFSRSPDFIIATLGILRVGAAYVPLDVTYPLERVRTIHTDAQVQGVLTDHAGYAKLKGNGIDSWSMPALMEFPPLQDAGPIKADAPAYLMYTSGTTGQPKGSLIPHRGIVRLVRNTNYVSLGANDRILHHSSPSFDAATLEIWGPLLNGGTLVIMPDEAPDIADYAKVIAQENITVLWLTAGLFHVIMDEDPTIFSNLKTLMSGGDVVSPKHVSRLYATCPHVNFINGYGPTENTTFSCTWPAPVDFNEAQALPIGQPIANSEAFIIDQDGALLPPGMIGELCVGGDGLSLGYWNRPELNARSFIAHPLFGAEKQVYRTGDRAALDETGAFTFYGRIDNQIKIRGYRIELDEVEKQILSLPEVRQASVVVVTLGLKKQLCAAVVIEKETAESIALLKRTLHGRLPTYMQPSRWLALKETPLTTNGKVDRRALESIFQHSQADAAEPFRNEWEQSLAEIWMRILKIDSVCRDDDFYNVGGDSLASMQLIFQIEKEWGIEFSVKDLFDRPTLHQMAELLAQRQNGVTQNSSVDTIITLKASGSLKPLFMIHGWGGELFRLTNLARSLQADMPVYGIQSIEKAGISEQSLPSIEALGERYAQDILKHQKDGPYYLCGFSMGGLIAYETARQLKLRGAEVACLTLIDTSTRNLPKAVYLYAMSGYFLSRIRAYLSRVTKGEARRGVFTKLKRLPTSLGFYVRNEQPPQVPEKSPTGTNAPNLVDHYYSLYLSYRPQRTEIPTVIFRSSANRMNLTRIWSYLTYGSATAITVDVTHHKMLEDFDLATQMAHILAEHQAKQKL
ncbi:non-ribosomal peptide synthetase [Cerasicoccus frondis]|uniref:non-ribosomal peptide synthetase n=1 Tax=Cerasicoccus frondis TaxID=490090 RepID=UPI002852AD6C|nr:non-ribosomal peptide synthetase [Cerasicoccus frondis]